MSKKWQNVATTIGVETIESTQDGVYLTTEQMDAIEASVATPEQTSLQASLDTANKNLNTANDRIATLEAELTAAQAKPGTKPAAVAATTDPETVVEKTTVTAEKTEAELERDRLAAVNSFSFTTSKLD